MYMRLLLLDFNTNIGLYLLTILALASSALSEDVGAVAGVLGYLER